MNERQQQGIPLPRDKGKRGRRGGGRGGISEEGDEVSMEMEDPNKKPLSSLQVCYSD